MIEAARGDRAGRPRRRTRRAGPAAALVALAVVLTACSSTTTTPTTAASSGSGGSGGSGASGIPSSAFSDHTGITATTVTVGNVSTLTDGLFKGAPVGTEAFADYVNSTGGIDGRKLVVDGHDDSFTGIQNKTGTQAAVQSDFAMVGSFSLEDSYGATVLAADPSVANVSVSLSQVASNLPNSFSVSPVRVGWPLGGLAYFKKRYPADITHTGAIVSSLPSAQVTWGAEQKAMASLGYKILLQPTYTITQSDFTQDVIQMKSAGVKILFMEQVPQNYAGVVLKELQQQDYHPIVVLGAAGYSEALVTTAGGPANADGVWLDQNTALYLGEDASILPAERTFLHWVQVASPGFKPDLYTLYGWLSGQVFADALRNAGKDPSRGSLLEQLRKVTNYDGDGLLAPVDVASKSPAACYLIARITNGVFQRVDDPATTSSTHGFRCDEPYYYAR
jgi:ABC-type branched-subunit amino acid transport system substrate-binding protein